MKQLFAQTTKKVKVISKKVRTFTMLAAVLASTMAAIPMPKAAAASQSGPSPRVSFTFDDGIAGSTDDGTQGDILAAKTLQQYGYTGTAYIITGCVGMTTEPNTCAANNDIDYMSWSDIASLHNTYGWEIGSHTETHPLTAAADNPSLTDAELDQEMSGSQAALLAHGYNATDFASPYGDYDNRSLAVIAKYYNSHRAFQDDIQPSASELSDTFPYYSPRNSYPYNNYLLTTKDIQGDGKTDTDCTTLGSANCAVSVKTAESYIAAAKASNQWLVLVFHDIVANGAASSAADDYQYNASDLATIAAYVKSEGITVSDVADGLASGTNIMPNSGFNDGIADGWTTDDPSGIVSDKQATSLAGHGSYDGTASGPLNSIAINSVTAESHLFSPQIMVTPGTTYTLTNFVNVTSAAGGINFYVDSYNSAGTYITTQKQVGPVGEAASTNNVQVGDVNFTYTPAAGTAYARVYADIAPGTTGYLDNMQWLSPTGGVGGGSGSGGGVVAGATTNTPSSTPQATAPEPNVGAFDGGSSADMAVFRASDGTWHVRGVGDFTYGKAGDIPVPGNYDPSQPNVTQVAVYRPSDGTWHIRGVGDFSYGEPGDIPVPGDYTGTGVTSIAVYRPSDGTWHIRGVGDFSYGQTGDIAVPGDYNGDGVTDIAVYRPSNGTWHIRAVGDYSYGQAGDIPEPGDYNGDHITDMAVYRPGDGTWHIRAVGDYSYGQAGDVPVPADYNGDGVTDIAVYRPSNGTWHIRAVGDYSYGQPTTDIPATETMNAFLLKQDGLISSF